MEIVVSIAAKISEYTIEAVFHQLGYLVFYNDNVKGLQQKVENLSIARSQLQILIDEATKHTEDIQEHVLNWLKRVQEITEEANKLLIYISQEETKSNCSNIGSCFNLVKRHRLSRKAKKMANVLFEIQEQAGKFNKVSHPVTLVEAVENISDYLPLESRVSIMDGIRKALEDCSVKMILVYGMGGVGKTMMAKKILCQVKESKLFEQAIMATIGQNPDVKLIQGQLAHLLSLEFRQDTDQGRAALLRRRIQKEKNILIILDDMWNDLDLEKIGIPSRDDHIGCKILVTSRLEHVLSNKMSINDKSFKVKELNEQESWKFFKDMADESIETNHELNKIALKVAKKCGKLPIALATVARTLKGKDLHCWRDALTQLEDPATVDDIEGVSKEVYASIRLSYDYLKHPQVQLLFLLCSMFPDDYHINKNVLTKYATGLKFLQGVGTLQAIRDRLHVLVGKLESSCLLQKSERGNGFLKMHDVIRDVAIHIGSKDDRMYTLSYGKGLETGEDEKTHGQYTAILANSEKFQDLHKRLSFTKLELLALLHDSEWYKDEYIRISEGFFEGMEKLKVLHMKTMYFWLTPSSFKYLVNLRILLLIDCRLGDIDMIGEMKNLEVLDFSKSDIMELPLSINRLSRLKQLNLFNCSKLKVIPPEVISRLKNLEELYVSNIFGGWEVEELNSCEKKNMCILELDDLPCLNCLYVYIPNPKYVPKKVFLELEEFQIIIGSHWMSEFYSTKKVLDIKMGDMRNVIMKGGVKILFEKCEELFLEAAVGMKDSLLELNRSDNSPHLKHLRLEKNDDVEYLMSELDLRLSCKHFSILETLCLWNMRRLESLIEGPIRRVKAFEKLRRLNVTDCDKLKYLFPFSMLEGLSNLEDIWVRNCKMIEAIVVMESEDQKTETATDKIKFKRLTSFELKNLPQLKSICCKLNDRGLMKSNENAEIVEEEQLIDNSFTPYNGQIAFPNLKTLCIDGVYHVTNLWHDQIYIADTIYLYGCENLKSIFIHNAMTTLKKLRVLGVQDCKLLEEVFKIQRLTMVEKDEGDFAPLSSELKVLILEKLPSLKQVWNVKDVDGVGINFQHLTKVEVKKCLKLKTLFPASLTKYLHQLRSITISQCGIDEIFAKEESKAFEYSKVSFPNMESLKIKNVDNLEIIWHSQLIVHDMFKLNTVSLDNCKSLKIIFPSNVIRALKKLEELRVKNCDSVEEVFEIPQKPNVKGEVEEDVDDGGDQPITINLKRLELHSLPSLKKVWSNDPNGNGNRIYHFPNLHHVEVSKCPKLKTIFPPSIAKHLSHQLKSLDADDHAMEAIFLSNTNTSEVEVKFNELDAFTRLAKMTLCGRDMIRKLCRRKFSRELFPALEVLMLDFLDDSESTPFSLDFDFEEFLYSLKSLSIENASLLDIFSCDTVVTDEEYRHRRYPTLKELYLTNLPELMCIWKENSHMVELFFGNLEVLYIESCSRLNTLVRSSSFSFQNLQRLIIDECHGLINLLDPVVARTLVHLKTMKLSECESMTVVLAEREGENEEDEIVFPELEDLELYVLPRLSRFQSAKSIIKFPWLKNLSITECPQMKMFASGIVYAPLLVGIEVIGKAKSFWTGNINATIQEIWEEDLWHDFQNLFGEEE